MITVGRDFSRRAISRDTFALTQETSHTTVIIVERDLFVTPVYANTSVLTQETCGKRVIDVRTASATTLLTNSTFTLGLIYWNEFVA